MTLVVSFAALVVSSVALVLLGIADPKRRRGRNLATTGARRGLLTALTLAPGFALIAIDAWAALLIWIGGSTIAGWATALLLAPAAKPAIPPITR